MKSVEQKMSDINIICLEQHSHANITIATELKSKNLSAGQFDFFQWKAKETGHLIFARDYVTFLLSWFSLKFFFVNFIPKGLFDDCIPVIFELEGNAIFPFDFLY